LEARLHRAIEEREALQQQVRELEKARIGCTEKLGSARQIKLKLEEARVGEEEALELSRCGFMEHEARLIQLREELADRRSRLNSLREIQKNYEGCGRGVRAIMRDAQLDARLKKGVRGLISDVLRTPLEMERAVEAVLGERLQAIVVSDQKKGLSLINYLRETGEGRGIFIPITVVSEQQKIEPDISVPGVMGAVLKHVGYASEYETLVRHLLGNVVLVKDLESAVAYSQRGLPHTVVTLDGEVLEPTGCMIGGTHEGAGVGTLNKKREMVELEEKVRALENDLAVISEQHRQLGEEIEQMEGVLKGLSQDSHSEALTVVEQEKDLHKATDDLSRAREQVEKLSREVDVMQLALSELSAEETSVAGQSAQAESEREGREARVRKLSEDLSSLKALIAELNAERTGLQVKVATDFERRDSSEKNLSRVEVSLSELEEREERLQTTVKEAQARRNQLEEKTVTTRADLEQWSQDLEKTQQERKKLREYCEEQAGKLEAEEARIRETRKNWEALQGNLGAYSLRERENSLELAHLCDSIRDRYAVELSVELYDYHMRKPPAPEMEVKLRDLREQVERMGEINLTAIEEHTELAKRHEFLKKQKIDLEQSLAQLKRAIVRINKTSKERFDHAFEIVNEKFQQVFPRLFNGGRAGLVLVPSEDGSEPGIEIMAQPPGKKLQSVNLLSGGEKALTAVALIFAIFLIKPTPFCLLDEVDAPLDDANVDRYNDLVREMSKISQFILITHNKRTMQIADTLYGVTMEEPGISKLVSVKMTEQAQAGTFTATTA
jgi:chromosome segregation protein